MKHSPLQITSTGSKAWWWAAAGLALAALGVALWPHARPAAGSPDAGKQASAQAWGTPSPFALPASDAQVPSPDGARPAAAAQPGLGVPAGVAAMAAASQPLLPPVEAPAESLRKVQMALGGGGTPQEALAAAMTLEGCKHAATTAESLHRGPEEPSPFLSPAGKKAMEKLTPAPATQAELDYADRDQRRCQVFDAATLARSGELLRRSYEGRAPGAANMYLLWLQGDGKDQATPALIATLQAEVRAAVEAGDFATLVGAAFATEQMLGTTPVQVRAYREAWLRIGDELNPGSNASTKNMFAALDELGHVKPLTPEQQRDANALAQQIVDAWRKRQHKGS